MPAGDETHDPPDDHIRPPGRRAPLRDALAERVTELRAADPLTPITLLVGASLQRPHLARWLAARLGSHAHVRILMPRHLALLLAAPTPPPRSSPCSPPRPTHRRSQAPSPSFSRPSRRGARTSTVPTTRSRSPT